MGSQSTSTSNQTTHNVATPTNPDWVTQPVQSLAGQIGNLSNLDPYSLVAGPNALQTQAAGTLSGLSANNNPAYSSASGLFQALMNTSTPQTTAVTGTASSLLPNLQSYISPYLNSVVNSALADYDFGAGQTRAQNQLALANDDTFGGSGGAIQTAMSNDAITRGRATLASQLLNQGFDTGANLANQDADRVQQMRLANMAAQNQAQQFNAQQVETALNRQRLSGEDLVNTAGAQNQQALADASAQASLGDQLRQIQAAYNVAPISLLSSQTGLLNSLPLSLFHGETQDGTSSGTTTTSTYNPIGAVSSLATGLSSLMGVPFGGATNYTLGGLLGRQFGIT
jgi:hypothetical protein